MKSFEEIKLQAKEITENKGLLDVWYVDCEGNKKILALALSTMDLINEVIRLRNQVSRTDTELENLQALFEFADSHIAAMYDIEWKQIKRKYGK